MVCLGLEPGGQDGRRRRIQGAMAAPRNTSTLSSEKYLEIFFLISVLGLTLTIG